MIEKLVLMQRESVLSPSTNVKLMKGMLLGIIPAIVKVTYVESLFEDPSGLSNRYWTIGKNHYKIFTPFNKNYKNLSEQIKTA